MSQSSRRSRFEQLRQAARAALPDVVATTIRIAETPAPTGAEGARAELVRELFEERGYAAELDTLADHWRPLADRATHHRVTLLYAARDEEHNHALALKNYLETWLRAHGPR